jgi:hydrogenase maturation protein HypF
MTIDHMKRILDIEPEVIACDLHPDYLSSRWATSQASPVIQIQHHFAHIVSCLAENHEPGPVIGLSFDGTGYGEDGRIWGGEVLIADTIRYSRAAHIEYIPMPGGTAAIRSPWRMAVSYLYHAYGDTFYDLNLPMIRNVDPKKLRIITQMIHKSLNSPLTSSLGRFFDGISAILGLRDKVGFEGQAAMELEMLASEDVEGAYPFFWDGDCPNKLRVDEIIKGVVDDIFKGVKAPLIAGKFHNTIIEMFTEICIEIGIKAGLNKVALSGGVFQNRILLNGLIQSLTDQGFTVLSHKQVPTNDGGISLGQAVAAACQIQNEKVPSSP